MASSNYSTVERFLHEQSCIRSEIQCLLNDIGGKTHNRMDDSDSAVAELLRQLDVLISTARGANMRLKECKQLTALVSYLIENKQITENKYASNSDDPSSDQKQTGRD